MNLAAVKDLVAARGIAITEERAAKGADRFWSRVDKNGPVPAHVPHLGPCWIWIGALRSDGYGVIGFGRGGAHKTSLFAAHRFSWALSNGTAPRQLVLHRCDNKRCVRPDHLFAGTTQDNIADKCAKGRNVSPRGEHNHFAKITAADADRVRALYATGEYTQPELAKVVGLGLTTVADIIRARRWVTLGYQPPERRPKVYSFDGLAGCVVRFRSMATKSLVGIYHGAQSGLDADPETPYVSVCESHSALIGHRSLRVAKRFRNPAEWCDDCRGRQAVSP